MNVRVLVVDDHPVVRGGLVGWLAAQPDLDVVGEASDGLEAEKKLADEMGHVGRGREAPHGGQPLPMDRPVDERVEPEQPGEMGMLVRDLLERWVRNGGDAAGGKRQDPVIHGFQQEAVQIDEVACDMEG